VIPAKLSARLTAQSEGISLSQRHPQEPAVPNIVEIAPDLFRISVFAEAINLQFNHFLIRDEEPVLFHTGLRGMFPEVREQLAKVMDPAKLRWIGFSHFESDECGALNEWLSLAPNAQAACGMVGALVSVNDFANRPARVLTPDEPLVTGKYSFRYVPTPHVPHGWDAGVLFEETTSTLLCSDLFHHDGDVEPLTSSDILGRVRQALTAYQQGPLANYMPYTRNTGHILKSLAGLKPKLIATMHGSSYSGNGEQALLDLNIVMKDALDCDSYHFAAGA
jgi:flavorubredoxin